MKKKKNKIKEIDGIPCIILDIKEKKKKINNFYPFSKIQYEKECFFLKDVLNELLSFFENEKI